MDVPWDPKLQTEDPKVVVGKCCDMGHRWMISKTVSDCVEALIGAYYVSGGLVAALHVMKWLGVDADLEPSLIVEAINSASLRSYLLRSNELDGLESKLGYRFSVKFLLQEAITHTTAQESYCYQVVMEILLFFLVSLCTWFSSLLVKILLEYKKGRAIKKKNEMFFQCFICMFIWM